MKVATVQTAFELLALVLWLGLVMGGAPVVGAIVLFAGLLIEHVIAFNGSQYKELFDSAVLGRGRLYGLSLTETIIWVVWLALTGPAPILAAAFLAGSMLVQHNAEINFLVERKVLRLSSLDRDVALFTVTETVAGIVWLILVQAGQPVLGAVVLAGLLGVEHVLQGRVVKAAA